LLRNYEIYDFGIAFSEGIPNYYLAKVLNAKIKIGRVPTDYKVAQLDKDFDLRYFNLLDYIITNSENNINVLRTIFPNISDKFILFRNVIRRESILAQSSSTSGFSDKFTGIRILTLSRLHDTKGTDLAVKACHLLAERGYKIKWYIMGDGDQHKYKELANACKITDQIEFLTPTTNPYPYLKECDIYVQPSRYEGFSNSILEAKVLAKPIVITSFGSAQEHIIHMFDGIIASMNEHSICDSISLLINDESLKTKLINNLKLKTGQDTQSFNYLLASLANSKFHNKQ
jgi:glycosyltransferase involved in cell wall biosynthesis